MSGGQGGRAGFRIRIATEDRVAALLAFHEEHLTEHLWPRTLDEFRALAECECLYEVVDGATDAIVGICYAMLGEEPEPPPGRERVEFGGIYVVDSARGTGIADAMCIVALANYHVLDPPKGRVIAHVHEGNERPRPLLTKRLGFRREGQEIPPRRVVPDSMAKNADGDLVGHLFVFQSAALLSFADWLERFSGEVEGKSGERVPVVIDMPLMARREAAITALRDLGSKHSVAVAKEGAD